MPYSRIKLLLKSPSLTNVAILSSGSLAAQLITFACSPILTRLYSTESVGAFTLILSIVSMFSGVICLRYDVPIVTATGQDYNSLVKLSIVIAAFLSVCVGVGSIVYAYSPVGIEPGLRWTVLFVPPLLMVAGLINVLNASNNRDEEYGSISKAHVARSAFQSVIMVVGGFVYSGAIMLLLSQLVGQLAGMREQFRGMQHSWKAIIDKTIEDLRVCAYAYRSQAMYSTPATFLNSASYSLVSLCVGNLFGLSALGLYSVSFRVLGAPLTIFSSNIAKVHCKQAQAELADSGCYVRSTCKMILMALVIILPLGLCLFMFSPVGFAYIFGVQWREAGEYVRILTPMFCLRFVAGSIGFGFFLSDKQWQEMLIQGTLLITLVGVVLLAFVHNFTIETFLIVLSVVWSFVYALEIVLFVLNSKGA